MRHPREQGFTLIETMVAMLVLVFGLVAVANLFFLAQSANSVANHQTAAAALATDVLERLKARPFAALVPGGAPSIGGGLPPTNMQPIDMAPTLPTTCVDSPANNCVAGNNYTLERTIPGVGVLHARWQIVNTQTNIGSQYFIRVAADTRARLLGGRALVEMSTWRMRS
jgi:prepilin-type N-terminal cleavage/methylation domain-containing protein